MKMLKYLILKHYNLFEKSISSFVNSDLIKAKIKKKHNDKLLQIKDDDMFKEARMPFYKRESHQD